VYPVLIEKIGHKDVRKQNEWSIPQGFFDGLKIQQGNGYLVVDADEPRFFDFLESFVSKDRSFLVVSRGKQRNILGVLKQVPVEFLFLTKNIDSSVDVDSLLFRIERFCLSHDNAVILLMRLDYLLQTVSFNRLLNWLYDLNDVVYESSSVFFVLCHDKSLVSPEQLVLLQNELNVLSFSKTNSVLTDVQIGEILRYVCEMNRQSVCVSFKDIRRRFDVSYPTVRKRVSLLESKGFVSIVKKGNRKVLCVTEVGWRVFDHL